MYIKSNVPAQFTYTYSQGPYSLLLSHKVDGNDNTSMVSFYGRSYVEHSWTFISVVTWNYSHGQKSRDKFAIVGLFSIHTFLTPSPTPTPTNKSGRLHPEFFPSFNIV